VGRSSKIIPLDGLVSKVGTTLFGIDRVPNVTVCSGTFEPCERMLMLPVPRGTLNWTVSLTTLVPKVWAGTDGVLTGAARAGSQTVVGAGVLIGSPTTTVGVLGGVHAGDALDDRQAPATQDASTIGATQSAGTAQAGKQNEPVEVLTHFPFAGHVV